MSIKGTELTVVVPILGVFILPINECKNIKITREYFEQSNKVGEEIKVEFYESEE